MITRPDEYKHTNANYAIVDNDNVRGGVFNITSLTTVNLLLIPADKRKLKTSVNDSLSLKSYSYSGLDLTDANWGLLSLWKELNKHVDGFSNKPSTPLTGNNVISQIAVNTNGHVTGVTTRGLTPTDIGASASTHTHSNATITTSGFLSSTDKTKLDNIETSADVNQNAFSNIVVNGTTIASTVEEDTFIITPGTGISVVPTGKTITISNTGIYTHPATFTDAPTTALSGANVISKIEVNTNGHVEGVTSRQLTPVDIGASASTHTHTNLLPSGGTIGQVLTKNSSTNYDVSFSDLNCLNLWSIVQITLTTTNVLSQIYNALPTDYNLKGKSYIFNLSAGTYVITDILDLSGYHNGSIVFNNSSTTPNSATISFPNTNVYSSTLNWSNGFIKMPIRSCSLSFVAVNINVQYTGATNGSLVLFSIYTYNHRAMINFTTCNITANVGVTNSFAVIANYLTEVINVVNTTFTITASEAHFIYQSWTPLSTAIVSGIPEWCLYNITATTPFVSFSSYAGGTSVRIPTIIRYYNIQTAFTSTIASSDTLRFVEI